MTTSTALVARVLPLSLGGRRAHRVLERNYVAYKNSWLIVASGFLEPVFYLFSMGIGLGGFIGEIELAGGQFVSYTAFVAPALLAASAMNGAVFESTFNIFFKLKYAKLYDAMLATPLRPGDIAIGEITWSLIRGGIYSVAFLIVMIVMGLVTSPWALLALPACTLIGLGFASVAMAATTFMTSWQHFDLVNLVTLPLFLFSATFYPLDVYPEWLQVVTQVSPLYHGVELIRAFTLGSLDVTLVAHAGVFVAMTAVGMSIIGRRLEKLLLA